MLPLFADNQPNRHVLIDGTKFLFFSGTAYLGLSKNDEFKDLIHEGQKLYGTVYGSSRNGNLQLNIYDEAEAALASMMGAPASLTLSSGMLAGQAVARQLMFEDYAFLYSPDVHPALWHLPKIDIPSISFEAWVGGLNQQMAHQPKIAILTNSTDALRGIQHDFEWITNLPDNQNIVLVIDDSHGIGIQSLEAQKMFQIVAQKPNMRLIITASLAKAMGLPGGAVFSDPKTLQTIRQSVYFSGCSPMAPVHLYAFLKAQHLYTTAQKALASNVALFCSLISDLGLFQYSNHHPVFYTTQDDLYQFLLKKNIVIYSFAYPDPASKPHTRIVISAWHTAEDIEKLAYWCGVFANKKGA
jgi:8-amino-7-oxononanoate synthase